MSASNSFWIARPPPYRTAARNATMLLTMVTNANDCRRKGWNRFSRYSGVVNTPEARRKGMKNQIRIEKASRLPHSDHETQMP